MAAEKRIWQRPELVVLVRSRPEEVVLKGCKNHVASGPGFTIDTCHTTGQPCLSNGTS